MAILAIEVIVLGAIVIHGLSQGGSCLREVVVFKTWWVVVQWMGVPGVVAPGVVVPRVVVLSPKGFELNRHLQMLYLI